MNKILIAYFSHAGENYFDGALKDLKEGNAKKIANKVAKLTGGELFEIKPVKVYPFGYKACCDEALAEQTQGEFPEMKTHLHSADSFDKMILVYPCWWGTMPQVVFTFLKENDFSNKEIYPICTHEGSGMGRSEGDLKKFSNKVGVGLAIQGSNADKCDDILKKWLKNSKIL